jgi:flagellar FliL protein
MSTATAAPDAEAAPKGGGKKKLIIIIAVVVLVLLIGGGVGVMLLMKKKGGEEDEHAAEAHAPKKEVKVAAPVRDPKTAPTFLPLDPFTVNLADRDAERYAQIAFSLEMSDPKQADAIKAYMPIVRNNILLLLSNKTAKELMERDGKEILADQILKETSLALGFEVEDEEEEDSSSRKRKRRGPPVALPVDAVHFSSFIIQ